MSPVDRAVIARKCGLMRRRLELLEPLSRLSPGEYRSDEIRKKGAEKLLQELINAAVDANVLVQSGQEVPADAYSSFLGLGRVGIVPDELASALAPFAGLRNRLVHEYETLEDRKVFDALLQAVGLFPQYLSCLLSRYGDA